MRLTQQRDVKPLGEIKRKDHVASGDDFACSEVGSRGIACIGPDSKEGNLVQRRDFGIRTKDGALLEAGFGGAVVWVIAPGSDIDSARPRPNEGEIAA